MREELTAVWRTAPAFQISHRWVWLSILKVSPSAHRFTSEIRVSAWFLLRPAFNVTSANSNSARDWNGFHGWCVLSFGVSILHLRSWYSSSVMVSAGRSLCGWYSILISSIEGPGPVWCPSSWWTVCGSICSHSRRLTFRKKWCSIPSESSIKSADELEANVVGLPAWVTVSSGSGSMRMVSYIVYFEKERVNHLLSVQISPMAFQPSDDYHQAHLS